ncbi:cAMP-regulated phosphoprotein-like protein [Senna tora]|uniref:cAMP-regulated phosphoprotein-like protein n=1 Tax=Senna tora TaxID=362788 RepID=A0A834X0C7_9FABA|nr:cAMP-regulated phosphoprotein-like protein [Senna tora]
MAVFRRSGDYASGPTAPDLMSNIEDNKEQGEVVNTSDEPVMTSSQGEEEALKKKYGGLIPKKQPLISKDHERAYFDSADWALGKQGGGKPKGPLEALRPKLQPTQQQTRYRKSPYAPSDEDQSTGNFFMKGLILFELKNALRKGINLGNTKDGIHWVDYRFERIPKCCYTCGVFGHEEEECETVRKAKQRNEEFTSRELGPWLKAGVIGRKVEWGGGGGSNGPREGQKGMYEERKVGTVKKVSTEELMEKLARMSMTENKETQLTHVAEMTGVGEENDGCQVGVELMKVAKTVINMNKEGGVEVAGTKQNKTLDTVTDVSKSNSVEGSNASMLDIVVNSQNVAVKGRTGGVRKFKRMAREKENCIPMELVKSRILNDLTNAVEEVMHLTAGESDHLPVLMETDYAITPNRRRRKKIFRFEKMWTTKEECKTIIEEAWRSFIPIGGVPAVTGKLEAVKSELTKWNNEEFGNVDRRIRNLQSSLQRCKEVLRKGLVRRIGDGTTTYIFKSPWIRSVKNFTIPYNNLGLGTDATVDELIMPESNSWNLQLVHQSFDTTVAEEILKIPLSKRVREDGWMWVLSNTGVFTVKTAYKAMHQSYTSNNRWVAHKGVWKRVWNMNVPPKIRNFMWRACRNILPTCTMLRNRGIDVDSKCCMCNTEDETTWHALYGCSVLQDFWRNRGMRFVDVAGNGTSFIDWFKGQLQSLSSREVEAYCILASKIWQRRNQVVHGTAPYSLNKIWHDTQSMLEMIKVRDEAIPTNPNITDQTTTRWQAPSSWFVFKLNVDASLRPNERGRIGCVIRDNTGRCIAALTKKIPNVVDVAQLEALAVYEGMCLAKSLMCTDIQVEGDSKQVMDLLKGGGLNRSANLVAHTLAFSDFNFPVNSLDSHVWFEDLPSIICNAKGVTFLDL